MSSAVPVPQPPAPERVAGVSRHRRHRRSFWKKLRRRHDFWRVISTAALWTLTVLVVWIILRQITE